MVYFSFLRSRYAFTFEKPTSGFATVRTLLLIVLRSALYFCTLWDFNFSRSAQCSNNNFWETKILFASHCQQFTFSETEKHSGLHSNRWEKVPLVESTCCVICYRLLQKIADLETKLLAGLPKQVEQTTDHHHGPPQHTSDESCESQRFIQSVQAKTDQQTNRWHKQGAIPKGTETSDCHEYLVLLP